MIEDGSKTHTIRARRKVAPRVGEICHCYTGLRQNGARLLGRFECVRVHHISIFDSGKVVLADQVLTEDERDQLAWRDGFRHGDPTLGAKGCFNLMYSYWRELGHSLPFDGIIVYWKFQPGRAVQHENTGD